MGRAERGLLGCVDGVKMARGRIAAAQIENVLISAGESTVTILPRFGGKIASIRMDGRELLQGPLTRIRTRTRTMRFEQGDASGWDECLPSVAACRVATEAGTAEIPDHGDLWRVEWVQMEPGTGQSGAKPNSSVTVSGRCFSLPLELERRVDLRETEMGLRLTCSYTVRNLGQHRVPWLWSAHPSFATEKGDRIVLPETIRSLRLEGSGGGRLGKGGEMVDWPIARVTGGGNRDLSIAEAADSDIGDKLFAGPLDRSESWCVLERKAAGLRIRVNFDTKVTPYLGLWICYGGWPEKPGPKQMCVAIEPATAPVDSLAITGRWSRLLAPGESLSWPMEVEIERIERYPNA